MNNIRIQELENEGDSKYQAYRVMIIRCHFCRSVTPKTFKFNLIWFLFIWLSSCSCSFPTNRWDFEYECEKWIWIEQVASLKLLPDQRTDVILSRRKRQCPCLHFQDIEQQKLSSPFRARFHNKPQAGRINSSQLTHRPMLESGAVQPKNSLSGRDDAHIGGVGSCWCNCEEIISMSKWC